MSNFGAGGRMDEPIGLGGLVTQSVGLGGVASAMSNTQAERVEALMELVDAHGAERWSTGYEEAKSPSGSPESAAYDAKAVSVREELRAEIAGLIADAERWRMLTRSGWRADLNWNVKPNTPKSIKLQITFGGYHPKKVAPELDSFFDDAIASRSVHPATAALFDAALAARNTTQQQES